MEILIQVRSAIPRRLQCDNKALNTLFETPAHKAETVDHGRDDARLVRKRNGCLANESRSELRWLMVTVRTKDSRSDEFRLTHWKKVSQSKWDD